MTRRVLSALATFVLAGMALWALGSSAHAQVVPTVTVTHGPATEETFVPECDDVGRTVRVWNTYTVSRDTTDGALDVHYTSGGSAQVITIPDGADHVDVVVVPPVSGEGPGARTRVMTAPIMLVAHAGYIVGDPSATTIRIVVAPNPGQVDCDPGFQFTGARTNSEQTITLGEVPVSIETTSEAHITVASGELPPGVDMDDSGQFTGAATTIGTYVAQLSACHSFPFVCRTTTLTVTVVPAEDGALPRTGSWVGYEALLGVALIGLGAALRRRSSAI